MRDRNRRHHILPHYFTHKVPSHATAKLYKNCRTQVRQYSIRQRNHSIWLDCEIFEIAALIFISLFSLLNGVMIGGEERDVRMPDGIRRDQFLNWVEQLEDRLVQEGPAPQLDRTAGWQVGIRRD